MFDVLMVEGGGEAARGITRTELVEYVLPPGSPAVGVVSSIALPAAPFAKL